MVAEVDGGLLDRLGLRRDLTQRRERLGQEDFLRLMVAQLRNQNPLQPMENGEFLTQIAQFGTVSGVRQLNAAFEALSESLYSSQALQAASLVGRRVQVPGGEGYLAEGGGLAFAAELAGSTLETFVEAKVDSVTLRGSGRGLALNLQGLGSVDLAEVRRIG